MFTYACLVWRHLPGRFIGNCSQKSLGDLYLLVFLLTWHELKSLVKREPQMSHCLIRLNCGDVCGSFSWLMIDVRSLGQCVGVLPCTGGPACCKKAGWTSSEEQVSEQCSSMACASVPALGSCPDCSSWWIPSCVLSWYLIRSIETPTKTARDTDTKSSCLAFILILATLWSQKMDQAS